MALSVEDELGASFISAEQVDENEYVEFAPALEAMSKEAVLTQDSEMSFPIEQETEPDLSLVSRQQANEDEYIEFAPPMEDGEEAGQPQGLEIPYSFQKDEETDSFLDYSQRADQEEYVEFAPSQKTETEEAGLHQESSLQETFHGVEELSATPEAVLSSEIVGEDIPSLVAAEQTDEYMDFSPHLLPTIITTWTDASLTLVMQEEPKLSADGATQTQINIPDYRNLPTLVQEEKPQRRHSLWRRLLAFLWP